MKPILIRQKGVLATWIFHEERHNKLRLLVTENKADEIFGISRPEIFRDSEMHLIDTGSGNGHPAMLLPGYQALIAETNAEILRRLNPPENVLEQPDLLTRITERDTLIQSLYGQVDELTLDKEAAAGDKLALEEQVKRLKLDLARTVEQVTHGKQREAELEQRLKEAEASCAYLDNQLSAAKRELEDTKKVAYSGEAFREQAWKEALGAEVETPASPASDVTGFDEAAEQAARIAESAPIVDADPGDEAPKPKTKPIPRPAVNQAAPRGWPWPFSWADAHEVIRLTVAGATTVGIVKELGINSATIQSIRTAFQPEINSLKRRNSAERAEYLEKMKAEFQKRAGVKAA